MKRVTFLGDTVSTQFGSFRSGDTADLDDAFAAHLVDEIKVAEYHGAKADKKAEAPAPAPVAATSAPAADTAAVVTPDRKPAAKAAAKTTGKRR